MPLGKRLSDNEKGKIDAFLLCGLNTATIAAKIDRSWTVVDNYIKLKEKYGVKKSTGRPKKITERTNRAVTRFASNKSISLNEIIQKYDLNIHKSTLSRLFAQQEILKYEKLKQAPLLTKQHKNDRLEWAERHTILQTDWTKIVWTDEKRFNLDGPDGFKNYWHNLNMPEECCVSRPKCQKSVMILAGFSGSGKTELAFINKTMNTKEYLNMLERVYLPYLNFFETDQLIFMQDNASVHTSNIAMDWFEKKGIEMIDWPSKSPDLNPIENVWAEIARKVYKNAKQYFDLTELKEAIKTAWDEIDQTYLDNLIKSMPKRCFLVAKNGGKTINY